MLYVKYICKKMLSRGSNYFGTSKKPIADIIYFKDLWMKFIINHTYEKKSKLSIEQTTYIRSWLQLRWAKGNIYIQSKLKLTFSSSSKRYSSNALFTLSHHTLIFYSSMRLLKFWLVVQKKQDGVERVNYNLVWVKEGCVV